jgi:GntR family transcriptional regulator
MRQAIGASMDFGRSAVARYIQLSTLFRRRIQSRQWRVGSQIPTVDELAAECGVARATIRQALGELEAEGLIERHRAKGTFVRKSPQEELWCAVATDWDGLLRAQQDAEIEILKQKKKVRLPAVEYPLGEMAPFYRQVRRRHWRHGRPFLLTDVHIDETSMKQIGQRELKTKTALRLIHDIPDIDIADVRQVMTIGMADAETAAALQIPLNAPIAFVYRRAMDANGLLVLAAEGIYRGDVVKFEIKLR